jgi:hypothetical protein
MHCNEVDLIAFHDNELSPTEKQEIQLHLNSCQSCQKELGSIHATMALLGQFWSSGHGSCPSTEKIVGYHEGVLDTEPTETIHEHLEDCSDCKRLIELLNHLDDGPALGELDEAAQPLPPRVRMALDEARRESLASRLKKTLETVVRDGKERLEKAPGAVSQMVDDLMAPREPDAAPSLAAPKNATEVKSKDEEKADKETGRAGEKGKA